MGKRSKSSSFNTDKSVLTTTLAVTDMRLEADYSVTFPGSGEAPAETRAGTVTEKVSNMGGNMESLHMAGFRKSSRQVLEDTMAKNMKVAINQAVHECNA